MTASEFAIVADGLRKRYRRTHAVNGIDLAVPQGSVCGLLGPNGAGKTTTVRMLSTLLRPSGGRAMVAGYDVVKQADQVRARIGLTGQNTTMDDTLTGRQNLELFGRLYHLRRKAALRRADELLEQFGLTEFGRRQVKHYSGGMRRRLDLAASFITAPKVLFLDEPTPGQDPRHRSEVWQAVRRLVDEGTTVFLTTHYLDEADQLADNIVVVDQGRVIGQGSPETLKSKIGGDQIDVVLRDVADLASAARIVAAVAGADPEVDMPARRLLVRVEHRASALTAVVVALDEAGITTDDIAVRRPTLDEVFLRLTGRRPEPAEDDEDYDEEGYE